MKPRKIPRGTFWIGGAVGLFLGVPLVCIALYLLPRAFGVGEAESGLGRIATLGFIFAGFPTFLTGGGVARLAAHRFAERVKAGDRTPLGRDLAVAAGAMALGGMATAVLVAVPIGGMPERSLGWLWVLALGLLAGGITGLAIGALVGLRARRVAAPAAEVTT